MKTVAPLIVLLAVTLAAPAAAQQPALTVWANPSYGSWEFGTGADPVPVIAYEADDPLGIGFSWQGDASAYGGTIDAYRPGWDVVDPDDPNDPGWLGGWGPVELTGQVVFSAGMHSFTVQVRDTAGAITTAVLWVDVQAPADAAPLPWGSLKASYYGDQPPAGAGR